MLNKLYENIKDYIKRNYKDILVFIFVIFIVTFEFPYYVDAPGGLLDTTDRVVIEGGYDAEGTFNMAYVREMPGTIATLGVAAILDSWDVIKEEEVIETTET